MKEDKNKKKSHAAGYAIILLVALIVILALLAGVFVTSSVVESSHEHTWDDGVETVAATCEDMGTMTYTCTGCGDKREEAIKPLGHDWENEYTEATCSTLGHTTQVCSRCGATQSIDGAAATGIHNYIESTDEEDGYVAATCTTDGTKVEICSVCGDIRTSMVEALGHDFIESTEEEDGYVAETCGTDGTSVLKCTRCGDIVTATVSATGNHSWDWSNGTVTIEETCDEDGSIEFACSECGETMTGTILALGHNYEESWEWHATLNYNQNGYDVSAYFSDVCTRCGDAKIARTSVTNITSNTDGTYTGHVEVEGKNYSDTRRVFADAISEGENEDEKEGVVTDVSMGTEYTPVYDDEGNMSYELTSVPTDTESTYVVIAGYVDGISVSVGGYLSRKEGTSTRIVNHIETLVFEEGVTSIGDSAFYYCLSLTSVTFCSTLTEIGDHSFYYCSGLTSVEFPDSLYKIGDNAFAKCSALTSLTFNDGLTEIGEGAFSDCTGIAGCIEIPSSVTSIGLDAFENCKSSGLTSVVIHGNANGTKIGDNAFQSCSSVELTVTFDGGSFDIGKYAFEFCNSLTTLIIINDATFTSVGSEAFRNNVGGGASPVTAVYYDGTGTEWDAIEAIFNAMYDNIPSGCKVYYYSDTEAHNCWHWGDDGMPALWNA